MNDDLDPLVETVLRQARAAVEPEPRQLAQALGGVLERLSRVELEDTGKSEPTHGSGARGDVARGARPSEWLPSTSLLKKPLVFWSWGALTAVVGFALGVQYERRTLPHPAEVTATVPHPAEITVPAPSAAPPSAAPEPTLPSSSSEAIAKGGSKIAERVLGPLPESPAPPTQSRAAPRPRGGAQKESPKDAPFEFRQVLDYVRRAERAERQGEPALALALLDELDERADRRTLREERLLTRVLASCARGDRDQAQRAARALEGISGESIYTKRLAQSCINETE